MLLGGVNARIQEEEKYDKRLSSIQTMQVFYSMSQGSIPKRLGAIPAWLSQDPF